MTILSWFTHWEPIWLFIILFTETLVGCATLYILVKEYRYDEQKDLEKKQKKTRTTKKTTTQPSGILTTEETTEVTEPMPSSSELDTSNK